MKASLQLTEQCVKINWRVRKNHLTKFDQSQLREKSKQRKYNINRMNYYRMWAVGSWRLPWLTKNHVSNIYCPSIDNCSQELHTTYFIHVYKIQMWNKWIYPVAYDQLTIRHLECTVYHVWYDIRTALEPKLKGVFEITHGSVMSNIIDNPKFNWP